MLLGVGAAMGCGGYLHQAENRIRNQYVMTTVLQARKYIKEGKPIEAGWVEEVPIPSAYLPPMALQTKNELFNTQGQSLFKARSGLLKGEYLSRSHLVEMGSDKSLAWVLAPGQTAITVKLAPEQTVAALIRPGDWVDVYWTNEKTLLLLSKVLVLAFDERLWEEMADSAKTPESLPRESHLVTLALAPEDAGRLVLACDQGRIVLALTSPLDVQIHKMRPLKSADM